MATLIGYSVTESKKTGSIGTTLWFADEFDDYRKESSKKSDGQLCLEEYIKGDWSHLVVGEDYTLEYGKGFEGKAVLKGIH